MVTIFKNIFSKEANHIDIDVALNRIKTGRSKAVVEQIRSTIDKERASTLKKNLPSVCFSGKFGNNRHDSDLLEYSKFIVLDFDDVDKPSEFRDSLTVNEFVKASWISPSGNGVKCLVNVASDNHKGHFEALKDMFPQVDKSGVNVSRVCYESFDPEIKIKDKVKPFTTVKKIETYIEKKAVEAVDEVFKNILKWLSNKGDAFRTGERNLFLYKLASACCRFGMNESECLQNFTYSFLNGVTDFSIEETTRTIKSAYRANLSHFNTASFDRDILITTNTKKEIEIDENIYNLEVKPKDVIFGEDVKQDAVNIFLNGFESATSTHIPLLDPHFKFKTGEVTLFSGIGNYGKSTVLKYLLLLQVIATNKKFAFFSPEDNPAAEFYHDLVEMYLGSNCTPSQIARPTLQVYESVYDFISKHIFYVYPKTISPTPEYIKERFLELVIKENINGCIIDPFNQLTNDYSSVGGRDDKYLETVLSDFLRFAQTNNQIFIIVAHPVKLHKPKDSENYPEPDVFDLAGGAMWNNKMDNILIYHRPNRGDDPADPTCTLTSRKIRRQKVVGVPGKIVFQLDRRVRRFLFEGVDYMEKLIAESYGVKAESLPSIDNNNSFLNE